MSRSYNKNPIYTDGSAGSTKNTKRFANKSVRRHGDVPNGNAYKKVFESWNIHDYVNRWTWDEAKKFWENGDNEYLRKHYPTEKEFYRYWLKLCKTK